MPRSATRICPDFRIACRDRSHRLGIEPGDRVGICMPKSADAVASMFGIMKAGAAYVPVDPSAPATRSAYIFQNCGVKAIVVEERLAGQLEIAVQSQWIQPLSDCSEWNWRRRRAE